MAFSHERRGPDGPSWLRFGAPLAVVVLVALAYAGTLRAGFVVWDDDDHVYENSHVVGRGGYVRAWRDWRDTSFYPLTFTTFYAEWRAAGGRPWLFHLDNVVLHAANGVLAGLVAQAVGLPAGAAWAAAGLWALHPVEVASVAWITERKNVLSVFFYLAALLVYARGLDAPSAERGRRLWLLSIALGAAALSSKATAVTLPVVLLVLHLIRADRRIWRCAPHLALAVMVAALHGSREHLQPTLDLGTRLLIAARAVWSYVGTFVWPQGLAAVYPLWSTERVLASGLPAAVALAAALGTAVAVRRSLPLAVWFAAAFFLVNIALVVGVVWFPYMRYAFVADHLAYTANIGLAMLAAVAGAALLRAAPGWARVSVVLLLWLVLAALSRRQADTWYDTERLWTRVLAVNPTSVLAHNNLGVFLVEEGRGEEARGHFEAALRVDPGDSSAQLNLGVLAGSREDWPAAARHYKRALRADPGSARAWNNLGTVEASLGHDQRAGRFFLRALAISPLDADAHLNAAMIAMRTGDAARGRKHFLVALGLNPASLKARLGFAEALAEQGKLEEALQHYEAARRLAPNDPRVRNGLVGVLLEQGDLLGAAEELTAAVERAPDDADLHEQLAVVLADLDEPARAVEHFERVLELDPTRSEARFQLGVALAAQGQSDLAEAAYREVLRTVPEHAGALNNIGTLLLAQFRRDEAIGYIEKALTLAPDDSAIRRNLATALASAGKTGSALRVLEEGLAREPDEASLINLIAWLRATSSEPQWRDATASVRLAERACALTEQKDANYLDTLAAAYADAGRFADAVRTARQALDLAESEQPALAEGLRARLALYEAGQPYREGGTAAPGG